jgi:hypothetical protein
VAATTQQQQQRRRAAMVLDGEVPRLRRAPLGSSSMEVPIVCLGTVRWPAEAAFRGPSRRGGQAKLRGNVAVAPRPP